MNRPTIVIIGAGGHGRETAEIVRDSASDNSPELLGFVDDSLAVGTIVDGLPVLGGFDWLQANRTNAAAIIALGSPSICRNVAINVRRSEITVASAVSPHANVSVRARMGSGVIVFPLVVVNTGARIESHVTLNVGASVSHDSRIGAFTNLNPGARVAGNVDIGECCYIGMGAQIIQNIKIGAGTTVGAGATVIADLPPNVVAVGVPARIVRHLHKETL